MTAQAAVSRPTLYLIPGGGTRSSAGPSAPVHRALPAAAAECAARVLGTVFAPLAGRLAEGLGERAPLLVRRGRPELWPAAIVFLLAEESQLFRYDDRTTRTSLARELGSSVSTLRRRGAAIRGALHPLRLDLPAPDPSLDLQVSGPIVGERAGGAPVGGGRCKM